MPKTKNISDVDFPPAKRYKPVTRRDTFQLMSTMPETKKISEVDCPPAKRYKPVTRRDTFQLMNPMSEAKRNSDFDSQPAKRYKPVTRRDTFELMNPGLKIQDIAQAVHNTTESVNVSPGPSGERKVLNASERRKLKGKAPHPPVSELLKESARVLNKGRGATLNDIRKHVEKTYAVDWDVLKYHVRWLLKNGVDVGLFKIICGASDVERKYKIKNKQSEH